MKKIAESCAKISRLCQSGCMHNVMLEVASIEKELKKIYFKRRVKEVIRTFTNLTFWGLVIYAWFLILK